MPDTYTQTERFARVSTPLGSEALLLVGLSGTEALSHLFHMQLELVAENTTAIPFEMLLGQKVTIELGKPEDHLRYISGICSRIGQAERDQTFTTYRMEVVPQFWFLTRIAQSRIFQQLSVWEILKKVLAGLDVRFDLQNKYEPRDYCVQYRETDFNFASRLMEEEGIFYFFEHSKAGHLLVLADTPIHPELKEPLHYDEEHGGNRPEERIFAWSKQQELRSGKYTLWDHCFELPHKHLEADKTIQDTANVGTVEHKLKVGANSKLEIYDFPGEYAQRFDGVAPGGGDRPADIQKIFSDNKRTVSLRMQEEALSSLTIAGGSNCRVLTAGYKFTIDRHFNADGAYLLTSVQHSYHAANLYRSEGVSGDASYHNSFTAVPIALPFRPARVTPRPVVQGSQTAVVVGPAGEEIFTDKYGRVKVQFHWDRNGKNDANSSCWIRVGTASAGKRWGIIHTPRIGQEVIVDFIEGDPDSPIIIGSVYNADQMPAYLGSGPDGKHANDNKISGIKTCSTKGGQGFNEIRFDDTKGKEQIFIHAERDSDTRVKHDSRELIIHDRHQIIGSEKDGAKQGDQRELVYKDKHLTVNRHHVEHVGGNMELHIGGIDGPGSQDIVVDDAKKETIGGDSHLHVKMGRNEKVDMNQSLKVGLNQAEKVGMNHALDAGMAIHLKAGMTVVIEAGIQLSLKVGGNFIDINPAGIFIQGTMVMINSGGAAGAGAGSSPTEPKDAKKAAPTKPDVADDAVTGSKSCP